MVQMGHNTDEKTDTDTSNKTLRVIFIYFIHHITLVSYPFYISS